MFNFGYKYLREDGNATAFDTKEAKEVAEELDDIMDSIPEVGDVDEVTNGGIPYTAEMCNLVEATNFGHSGRKRYLLEMNDLIRLMEAEEIEDAGEAVEKDATANSGHDPESGEDITIQQDDVVVVVPSSDDA